MFIWFIWVLNVKWGWTLEWNKMLNVDPMAKTGTSGICCGTQHICVGLSLTKVELWYEMGGHEDLSLV